MDKVTPYEGQECATHKYNKAQEHTATGVHFFPAKGVHFIPATGVHFIPAKGVRFIPATGGVFYSCNCRNDLLLTYKD